ARRNGALSKGPVSEEGKAHASRNAITHGRRAGTLALFVPPQSSLLANEDRQAFFALIDQNVAKYAPADSAERALVREISDCQWTAARLAQTRTAMLNRELFRHRENVEPIAPEFQDIEPTAVAYQAIAANRAMSTIRQEYMATARLTATLERRLYFMQKNWPSTNQMPAAKSEEITEIPLPAPEPSKRPDDNSPQPIENTENEPTKYIYIEGDLTPEVIAFYRSLFPNRDLSFRDKDYKEAA
ncbi:MAG: hypothetical protein ACKV2U_12340, partial [Bryobacteraceae bacterium]